MGAIAQYGPDKGSAGGRCSPSEGPDPVTSRASGAPAFAVSLEVEGSRQAMMGSFTGVRRGLELVRNGRMEDVREAFSGEGAKDVFAERTRAGMGPLCEALLAKRRDVALLLMELGADVEEGPASGWTPLVLASKVPDAARRLLDLGADPKRPTAWGLYPLQAASSAGDEWLALELLEFGGPVPSEAVSSLVCSIRKAQPDLFDALMEAGDLPDQAGDSGETPLMAAAGTGSARQLQALLAAGASVGRTDSMGMTALHYAAAAGNSVCYKLLAQAGADEDSRDASDETARGLLERALRSEEDQSPVN